jgi:hypothetical protein
MMDIPDHRPQYFLPAESPTIFAWQDTHDASMPTPTFKVITLHRTTLGDNEPWIYEEKGWNNDPSDNQPPTK